LMSHLGRPNGKNDSNLTLEPIAWYLEDALGLNVFFSNDCISEDSILLSSKLKPGEILLLENLRFYKEESSNDSGFSQNLSKHGDVYINDAFGTSHRSHSSNVGIAKYFKEKGFGFLINNEIKYLKESMDNPKTPLVFIMGGAKISTKIELINHLIDRANTILIGGAMAFTFLKSMDYEIGNSLFEEEYLSLSKDIMNKAKEKRVNLIFPSDIVCTKDIRNSDTIEVKGVDSLDSDDIGLDIGPETCINFEMFIKTANTVVWNGPMGFFENPYFSTGTQTIATSLQDLSENREAITIIGGGDTVTAIDHFNKNLKFTHVSTGGGSSLEMLSGKDLPALKSLGEE